MVSSLPVSMTTHIFVHNSIFFHSQTVENFFPCTKMSAAHFHPTKPHPIPTGTAFVFLFCEISDQCHNQGFGKNELILVRLDKGWNSRRFDWLTGLTEKSASIPAHTLSWRPFHQAPSRSGEQKVSMCLRPEEEADLGRRPELRAALLHTGQRPPTREALPSLSTKPDFKHRFLLSSTQSPKERERSGEWCQFTTTLPASHSTQQYSF